MRGDRPDRTYKTVEADPVWVCLTTGRALHLESVVVGVLRSILRAKFGDSTLRWATASDYEVRESYANKCRQKAKNHKVELVIIWKPHIEHTYPVSSAERTRESILLAGCWYSCNAERTLEGLDNWSVRGMTSAKRMIYVVTVGIFRAHTTRNVAPITMTFLATQLTIQSIFGIMVQA